MSDSVRWTVRMVFHRRWPADTERCVIQTDYGHSHPSQSVEKMIEDGYAAIEKRPSWEWQAVKDKGWDLVMLEVWPGIGLIGSPEPYVFCGLPLVGGMTCRNNKGHDGACWSSR